MKSETLTWNAARGWSRTPEAEVVANCQWALYFGSRQALEESKCYEYLRHLLPPECIIMGCSSGGEIIESEVVDNTVVVILVAFKSTRIKTFTTRVSMDGTYEAGKKMAESFEAGRRLSRELNTQGLKNIFLLSDGLHVNGDELVRGIFDELPESVIVTGGLAGDGADFQTTLVGLDAPPEPGMVVAVGFYGNGLEIGYGSVGGWDTFGPERRVTKSDGNILYELDGQPALDLYKAYLREEINTPTGILLFPLSIYPSGTTSDHSIVRTVMSIDEEKQCLIFGGDVPQGHVARLMQGNFDHLVDGACRAANLAKSGQQAKWDVAVIVSCIGRKILLGQRIGDETEAVKELLPDTPVMGFYSYGEICHHEFTQKCGLHNQTMTITMMRETE